MSGNVWEWCLNEYDDPWRAETTGEAHRVVRGGSWFSLQSYARVSSRHGYVPDYRGNNVGFRVCADRPLSG